MKEHELSTYKGLSTIYKEMFFAKVEQYDRLGQIIDNWIKLIERGEMQEALDSMTRTRNIIIDKE